MKLRKFDLLASVLALGLSAAALADPRSTVACLIISAPVACPVTFPVWVRIAGQPHDSVGRGIQTRIPEREHPDPGRRFLDSAARIDRRYFQPGAHEPQDEGQGSGSLRKAIRVQANADPVAIDALAVYVHKDNPIKGLALTQVDAMFSSTRKCGNKEEITSWDSLGLGGALGGKNIQLYGRNSVSGTYGYFKNMPCARVTTRTP